MHKSVGVPIIAFCRQDDNVTAINAILRQAGMPVHCTRVRRLDELKKAIEERPPELLIVFDEELRSDLSAISELLSTVKPSPPMLLARSSVTEQSISDAMEHGARDVVSLTHKNRFRSVVDRELQAYRMQVALGGVIHSANQYREELKTLMEGSAEAIADVQEGIIVAANPTWVELFGYRVEDDLTAVPFMDLCDDADQPMLKGALVACLRDKWDGSTLKVNGRRADGTVTPIAFDLERVTIDDDPAIRVVVPGIQGQQETPIELLEQAVLKDPATGFYHRHFFLEKVEERINTPLTGGVRAIAYIRPDKFSQVHEDIGMLATENLLTQLAGLLQDFMHPSDIYGRFGGTMFTALVERGNMTDVESWAEQIRKVVADHLFEVEKRSTSLTCTIGLLEVEREQLSLTQLFSQVEQACRTGRAAGGDRVQFTENTDESRVMRQEDAFWAPRIRKALVEHRFKLIHQPISGLNEEITGVYDTRVKMLDEDGNPILASEFIAAAERVKIIKNIDRWVIDASLSYCAKTKPKMVFVRLSTDSILDNTLLKWVKVQLQKARIIPSQICFQVTEEEAHKYLKQVKHLAEQLRKIGFLFAVDHLCGQWEPDQLLQHLPMQYVKIDGSLMQGLRRNTETQETIKHIAKLAAAHKVKTIAERVEDANTMAILWQLGISFIQGNYVQMHGVVLEDTHTVQGLAVL